MRPSSLSQLAATVEESAGSRMTRLSMLSRAAVVSFAEIAFKVLTIRFSSAYLRSPRCAGMESAG